VWYEGEKYFFESSADSVFPFDPFAASFYLVSRYEEYLGFDKDKYKRFPAENCLLYKYGLLKKPVVNIWARMIAEKLKEKFPALTIPEPGFRFLPTIDVDNAWAYAHKGLVRSVGALLKAAVKGKTGELRSRLNVLIGKEQDAFDTYEFIDQVFEGNEDKVTFFFLLGNYRKYDKNVHWKNRHLQNLIRRIASRYDTGIHPSYYSAKKKNKKKLAIEINRLKQITGRDVKKSRQHFLRLKFPWLYRNLLLEGITEDFTMGYPSHSGFRAGICTPFPFYDLKTESSTSLIVVPFQVMDVTFRTYMKLSADEALAEIKNLMQEVKEVGGTFSYIWHNETLTDEGDWKGFREVFMQMNKTGFEWSNANK
jgi:hypothetical protein